ncbi:hypothetical protein [Haloferula sp.]|uniref:hypothetical protein n=1 Tax=Haloferula sp. TaxID=2497595 RepID=UPI00329D31B0
MRTILLGDVGNRLDIADTEREIKSLKQQQRNSRATLAGKDHKILNLQAELSRQKLAIQALSRFLVAKGIIQQDELDDFISEVDAEDGELDGKMDLNSKSLKLQFPKKTEPFAPIKVTKPTSD